MTHGPSCQVKVDNLTGFCGRRAVKKTQKGLGICQRHIESLRELLAAFALYPIEGSRRGV